MGYTENEITDMCHAAISDISNFYNSDFVNYQGMSTDTHRLYTEIIAEYIIGNISSFQNGIRRITRENSYKTKTHDGEINPDSNRMEENIAKRMFKQCQNESFDYIGRIIDYQIPLKNKQSDNAGKIDLLSDNGKSYTILELKRPDSTETMLRCVLEGYTYFKTVDKSKLLKDFGRPDIYEIRFAPFVFKDSRQYKEMQMHCPELKRLMNLLNSKPYYIIENGGKFFVTED